MADNDYKGFTGKHAKAKHYGHTVCQYMHKFGLSRPSLMNSALLWAAAIGALAFIIIILSKPSTSTFTIGDLQMIAVGIIVGFAFGILTWGTCWLLNHWAPSSNKNKQFEEKKKQVEKSTDITQSPE